MSGQSENMSRLVRCAVVGAAVGVGIGWGDHAAAQTAATFLITFDGVVTPQHPTMTVGIWATWADPTMSYLFGASDYDLTAGDGEFTSGELILGNDPPNTMGVLSGRTVIGAAIGQIHIVGGIGIFGKQDNPILLATYEWTTTDFTPRTIAFETSSTAHFFVYLATTGATIQLFPHEFTPGRAEFVIPASSTLALIACSGLAALRRRTRGTNNV